MRSRLTARQMYERFLDGDAVRWVAADAYAPRDVEWAHWLATDDGRRAVVRTEDRIRQSCRKYVKVPR